MGRSFQSLKNEKASETRTFTYRFDIDGRGAAGKGRRRWRRHTTLPRNKLCSLIRLVKTGFASKLWGIAEFGIEHWKIKPTARW